MTDVDGPLLATSEPDPDALRHALAHFASGVTVVTARDGTTPVGTTVNAFSSISLVPPLVMVSLERRRSLNVLLRRTPAFAVNILGEDDRPVADCFAGAPTGPSRTTFCGTPWHEGQLALPLLDNAVATLECRVDNVVAVGDHDLFIGRVYSAVVEGRQQRPLIYYARSYLHIAESHLIAAQGRQPI